MAESPASTDHNGCHSLAKETLKNKVDRLLASPAVTAPLTTHGLAIVETSTPNQTETTQRWKVGLRCEGEELPIRTKVEFSRRAAIEGTSRHAGSRSSFGAKPYPDRAKLNPLLAKQGK